MILFLDNGSNHLIYQEVTQGLGSEGIEAGVLYFSESKYRSARVAPGRSYLTRLGHRASAGELERGAKLLSRVEAMEDEFTPGADASNRSSAKAFSSSWGADARSVRCCVRGSVE